MRRIRQYIAVSLLLFGSTSLFAQSALTFTSNKDDVRFTVLIDNQQMTDFFETWIRITNIPAGFHEVTLVFEGDSIADYFKNIMCKDGTEKNWAIVEKKDLKKSINKSGRQVGKKLDVGEHDESFYYLQDIYELKLIEKQDFKASENTELEVSTENSISTSVLPIQKQKH